MQITDAYVIGLLADLEERVPALEEKLQVAQKRSSGIDQELLALISQLQNTKNIIAKARMTVQKMALNMGEQNMNIASLHQEIAAIKRCIEDISTEMARVGQGAIQRKLRRERAKLGVAIEDREAEIEGIRAEVESLREQMEALESQSAQMKSQSKAILDDLDKLQALLPSPYTYAQLYLAISARAHCRYFLDKKPELWANDMNEASVILAELQADLKLGKYRLDKNSDLLAGRSMASAEGLYASVAMGNYEGAIELFESIVEPNLFFHHIFNIFRVWCLGLYLSGNTKELKNLLRHHQFASGLRGGYVLAFIGLLAKDARRVEVGLKLIVKHETELWLDVKNERGAGVLNMGALAIARLAKGAGLDISKRGLSLPGEILKLSA